MKKDTQGKVSYFLFCRSGSYQTELYSAIFLSNYFIGILPMSNFNHHNQSLFILNEAEKSIITNPEAVGGLLCVDLYAGYGNGKLSWLIRLIA
ncbi:MAG: hypothetical protein D3903_16290 [Candidatus Electrothrix sp. GM3_4]|nr:hypothetical protein [Candidatus Electrothrix sp. GM3_4]